MDASVELIRAMMDRLNATPAVSALVGNRIYDRVPEKQDGTPNVPYPYISLGPDTMIPEDFDCIETEEITVQWDVWTSGAGEAYGTVQCRKICGAVKKALHGVDLNLPTHGLVSLELELRRIIDDPNPALNHGVMQFTAQIDLLD